MISLFSQVESGGIGNLGSGELSHQHSAGLGVVLQTASAFLTVIDSIALVHTSKSESPKCDPVLSTCIKL